MPASIFLPCRPLPGRGINLDCRVLINEGNGAEMTADWNACLRVAGVAAVTFGIVASAGCERRPPAPAPAGPATATSRPVASASPVPSATAATPAAAEHAPAAPPGA